MATVRPPADDELSPDGAAVFDDIRAVRQPSSSTTSGVHSPHDPGTLKHTWKSIKQVMDPRAPTP